MHIANCTQSSLKLDIRLLKVQVIELNMYFYSRQLTHVMIVESTATFSCALAELT